MTERLEVLLGIHDIPLNKVVSRLLRKSHEVSAVATLKEMSQMLGIVEGVSYAEQCRYAVVIMDVNLDSPGADNIAPGREIYQYLQPLIEGRQVKFTTVSGNDAVVEKALREGIPCVPKPKGILEYIRALQQ